MRIPSISTDPQYSQDVQKAGRWVEDQLKGIGLTTEYIETSGYPIVFAESEKVENAPTVLVYGHYDVQPPDPLDEWINPPFEPTRRDGNVYARGATDDKGQMLTHIKSAEAWIKTVGKLPINLKYLIEGEEESGGLGLSELLNGKHDSVRPVADRLKCDIAVISDNAQFAKGQPAVTYGLRGMAYFELRIQGPSQDLHSGIFGGGVTNPINTISKMLASLIDENGRIQIPGFYDDVIELTELERSQFSKLDFDESQFNEKLSVAGTTGEVGYTNLERRWARPTYDINGIWGGYQAAGAKTVLPAKCGAKFSFRLVPDQDPEKIHAALEQHLQKICPPGITIDLEFKHGGRGVVVPMENPFMSAAANAVEAGFGVRPVFVRSGGSIPVVTSFKEKAGVDTLMLGWGQDDDNLHSPNEKFSLADFHRGIQSSAHLWDEISKVSQLKFSVR